MPHSDIFIIVMSLITIVPPVIAMFIFRVAIPEEPISDTFPLIAFYLLFVAVVGWGMFGSFVAVQSVTDIIPRNKIETISTGLVYGDKVIIKDYADVSKFKEDPKITVYRTQGYNCYGFETSFVQYKMGEE